MLGSEPSDTAEMIRRIDERVTNLEVRDTRGSTAQVASSVSEEVLVGDDVSSSSKSPSAGWEWGTSAWGFDNW